jgi:hypothetical protein
MRDDKEMIDVTTVLERVRDDLVEAITADQRRSSRRRGVRLASLLLAGTLGLSTAVAAATGWFSPAPESVKSVFNDLNGNGVEVDASKAIEIGVIDDHPAYSAPTSDGGFCLYFGSSTPALGYERSGPGGTTCTVLLQEVGEGEIVLAPQWGHDGGFAFGRVGTESAVSVAVTLPDGSGTVTAEVASDGFFLADLPESVLEKLARSWPATLSATATDADGTVVARSTPALEDPLPNPAPDPEPPTP